MSSEIQSVDTDKPQGVRKGLSKRINSVLIFVIIVIFTLIVAWQWYDTRDQIADLQHELAKRLAETDVSSKESRNFATEATEAGRRVEAKLNLLEAKLAESQSRQLALEGIYQERTRKSAEVTVQE